MTDRHAGYLIALQADLREDDAEESVLMAIRQIKRVTAVTPVIAGNPLDTQIAITRRDKQWCHALRRIISRGPEETG